MEIFLLVPIIFVVIILAIITVVLEDYKDNFK